MAILDKTTRIVLRPEKVELIENWLKLIQGVYEIKTDSTILSTYSIFLDTSLELESIQYTNTSIDVLVKTKESSKRIGRFKFFVTNIHDITSVVFQPAIYPVIEYSA